MVEEKWHHVNIHITNIALILRPLQQLLILSRH